MNIRPASESDVPALRDLGRNCWWAAYASMLPPEYIEMALATWWSETALKAAIDSASELLLVAEEDVALLGIAHTAPMSDTTAILWKLYVLREFQQRGVGAALLEATERLLPAQVDRIMTEYYAQNVKAGRFYAHHGFGYDHREAGSYHGQEIESVYVARPRSA